MSAARRVLLVWAETVAAMAVAVAVSVAWIAFRRHASSVDVALVLMLVITAAGGTGRRRPVVAAAVAAALGFTFFDTAPFDRFAITRPADVVTGALLVAVGLATGELAVRVVRQRQRDRAGAPGAGSLDTVSLEDMARVRHAASSLAAGDELVEMIGAVAADLTRLLELEDCTYSADRVRASDVWVDREGCLRLDEGETSWLAVQSARRPVSLPVWGQGQVLGHFVLHPGGSFPTPQRLLVAVTLADQVGAALFAQAPPPDPDPGHRPPPPHPGLRVVR